MNKLPILTLLAATAVAGCSSTGTATPEPEPFPESVREDLAAGMEVSMLQATLAGVTSGTATVQMTEDASLYSVEVGGTSYHMVPDGSGWTITRPQWSNPVSYAGYSFAAGDNTGTVILGRYAFLAGVGTPDTYATTQGGLTTPDAGLPEMVVEYEGMWGVQDVGGGVAQGLFNAEADFDTNAIAFALTENDGSTAIGAGAGTISGNSFSSTFDVTSGMSTSANDIEGNFYGPGAQEIAGLVTGTSAGGDTFGFLLGHQK